MTVQQQEQLINEIKFKSSDNERLNTVTQTKAEGYREQIVERVSKLTDKQREELGIDLELLGNKDYIRNMLNLLKNKRAYNDELFETLSSEALVLLGLVGR